MENLLNQSDVWECIFTDPWPFKYQKGQVTHKY